MSSVLQQNEVDKSSVRSLSSLVWAEQSYAERVHNQGTPDANNCGWQLWLNQFNRFNGNFMQADMVKAFILSPSNTGGASSRRERHRSLA